MFAISFSIVLSNFGHLKPPPPQVLCYNSNYVFFLLFGPVPLLLPVLFCEIVHTVGRKPELDS